MSKRKVSQIRTQPRKSIPASAENEPQILPYSCIVGQDGIKLALELSFIEPRLGGVLLSGHRGTAKSTAVRAFSMMAWGRLPVTLPINATEDRVVGGWKIESLLQSQSEWQPGVLEEADNSMLYIDEVNLLDDHVVNLILDVASTHILVVQREAKRKPRRIRFSLVGTMNPEEGGLRAQLLDRFGLVVTVAGEKDVNQRIKILRNRMLFEERDEDFLQAAKVEDELTHGQLLKAQESAPGVAFPDEILKVCIDLAESFRVEGHRSELTLLLAARAHAARQGRDSVTHDDVIAVAGFALPHRRKDISTERITWTDQDQTTVQQTVNGLGPTTAGLPSGTTAEQAT